MRLLRATRAGRKAKASQLADLLLGLSLLGLALSRLLVFFDLALGISLLLAPATTD